jgi:hypothetical protein
MKKREKHFPLGEKEEESDGEDEEEPVDQRRLEIECGDRIDERSEEDVVRGEEESGDIGFGNSEESFGESEESDSDIGGEGAEDEEDCVGGDAPEKCPKEILRFEINIKREEEDGESDLDADAIGHADFRSTAEEGEEATDEPSYPIEFVETPVARSAGDIPIENRRG